MATLAEAETDAEAAQVAYDSAAEALASLEAALETLPSVTNGGVSAVSARAALEAALRVSINARKAELAPLYAQLLGSKKALAEAQAEAEAVRDSLSAAQVAFGDLPFNALVARVTALAARAGGAEAAIVTETALAEAAEAKLAEAEAEKAAFCAKNPRVSICTK